jgi:rare lipoprotein A
LGSTFVAVPVVVLDNLPQQQVDRADAEELHVGDAAASTTTAPSTTTITVVADDELALLAPPTTAATTSTAPPTTAAPTTTTVRPTTTTAPPTTQPPTTTTTTAPPPPPPPPNTESGKATWYRWNEGECAHKTLPRGTVVTITNLANGRTATCTVTDRGPYGGNRIIDLDDGTFAQLAPLSAGIIDVTITW